MYAFIQTVVVSTTPQDSLECGFDYISEIPAHLDWVEDLDVIDIDSIFGDALCTQALKQESMLVAAVTPSMPRAPKDSNLIISVEDLLDACFGEAVVWPEATLQSEAVVASTTIITPSPAIEAVVAPLNDLGAEEFNPGNGWGFWALDNLVISYQVGVHFNISYINKEVGLNLALGTAMQGVA